MEYSEFKERIDRLKKDHKDQIFEHKKIYAESNRKYTVGDILETKHNGIVLVQRLGVTLISLHGDECECKYIGLSLKKSNLEPYKNGNIESFGQSHVVRIIKQREKGMPEVTLICDDK